MTEPTQPVSRQQEVSDFIDDPATTIAAVEGSMEKRIAALEPVDETELTYLLGDLYSRAFNRGSAKDTTDPTADIAEAKSVIQAAIRQAELHAYDGGYEEGRSAKPAKLIDALNFRREQYGWNEAKMAAMLNMSRAHYSEFKHGKRGLPVAAIRKAYAIGIPASVLLQDDIDRRLELQAHQPNPEGDTQ